jgi:glucose/arabinose dehydrogenase
MKNTSWLLSLLITTMSTACVSVNRPMVKENQPQLEKLTVPEGFKMSVFATDVQNARSMTLGEQGTLFVGSRGSGNVYALQDTDGDFQVDQRYTLASGLNMPNGVAFRKGALYVAEVNKIWRYDGIEDRLDNPPDPVLITDSLPDESWHGWKYIAFGPDDKLYVPVGAPCNICEREDQRYASILRMNPDGSEMEVYASGVRNTVGFAWHPVTQDLWFTDNGRDLMTDDVPPDELNHAAQAGQHFGFPYCHGGDVADPKFGSERSCSEFVAPVQKLAPHTAALGMKFYTDSLFPASYLGNIFIAEHGSWNRKEPLGYRITRVVLEGDEAVSYEPFVSGWLTEEGAWGRPVDILQYGDGSLLISDDHAHAIYRLSH